MLGYQADQGHQADLRIDVERREIEKQEYDGTEDRHRHRHHDDQRITEALELRRQNQEDDDDCESQGCEKATGLLHVLS